MASERPPPASCVEDHYCPVTAIVLPWYDVLAAVSATYAPGVGYNKRIEPACRNKPAELNQVNPAFARFHFGYPTMWNLETCCQVALREAGELSCRQQFCAKGSVFSSVS